MGRSARLTAILGSFALVASTIAVGVVAPTAQSEEYRLPATDFQDCRSDTQYYCIESVEFERDGYGVFPGVWVEQGSPVNSDAGTSPVLPVLPPSVTNYQGRWSFDGWPTEQLGYDGIYVQVGPASQASDFAWIRMQPTGMRADYSIGRAVVSEGSTTPRDLDPGMKITVNIRFGPLEPTANVMVANGSVQPNPGTASSANNLKFSGYPVKVPRAASSTACNGEDGKAADILSQMYAFVVFGNTRQSFGYDGMSGGLSVSTNGTCYITTPTYDPATGAFSFVASAPHFAPDGIGVNRGFYIATIPLQDAALLFGITDPKQVKAVLELSVENEMGEDVPVQYSVASRRGVITVAALNFQYSKPTFTLKVKPALWKKKYKKLAEANRKKAGNP